jgi:hypothetical protein
MTKPKPSLEVEKRSDGYLFTEVRPTYEVYHGRVHCLSNNIQYAIVFDQEIPSAGMGPPFTKPQLLKAGDYPMIGRHYFLEHFMEIEVISQAKKLAKEKGLVLKLAQSQPKCTKK